MQPSPAPGQVVPLKIIFSDGSYGLNFSCYNKTYNVLFEGEKRSFSVLLFILTYVPNFGCQKKPETKTDASSPGLPYGVGQHYSESLALCLPAFRIEFRLFLKINYWHRTDTTKI